MSSYRESSPSTYDFALRDLTNRVDSSSTDYNELEFTMKSLKQPATQATTPLNREQRRDIQFARVQEDAPQRRRAIRLPQVLEIYPVSEAQLYKEIAAGVFPCGFRLTPGGRAVAWWSDEIQAIVEARAAASQEGK